MSEQIFEELEIEPPDLPRAASCLLAGIALEQGLADKKTAKRWRQAVTQKAFQAEKCARDVLADGAFDLEDPRLVERASRLLRDFLMAPLQQGVRGAARRSRERARSGLAYVLAQAMAFGLFSLVGCAIAILLRMRGHSLNRWADWVLGLFGAA